MRRRVGVLLAGLLLAAACGGNGDNGDSEAANGDASTTAPGSAPTPTTVVGGPDAGTAGSDATGEGPVTSVASGGGAPPTTSGVSPPIGDLPVGQLAPFLLRPGHGNRIVVQLRTQAGAEPAAATVEHLVRVLRDASGKQVLVDGPDLVGGSGEAWTASSLRALADRTAPLAQGGEQVVLRLLFLHGTFEGDTGVLGVAARGDVAAVFSDQVDAAAGLLVDPAVVEDAVAVHEVGHLMGLVDLVVGSGRGDPEHPGHSRSRHSVMYWAVESDLIGQLFDGGIPSELDADDRAELATIRRS